MLGINRFQKIIHTTCLKCLDRIIVICSRHDHLGTHIRLPENLWLLMERDGFTKGEAAEFEKFIKEILK